MARLTEKQRSFIELYMGECRGNATKSARLAGYRGNLVTLQAVGAENLRKPLIQAEIALRQLDDPHVLSRKERQQMYTTIAKDTNESTRDRLKALELLAKTGGDFVQKVELGVQLEGVVNVNFYIPDNGRLKNDDNSDD